MMKTIVLLNQKGGVGKTTIADELAFALERAGKQVAFVTTDPQGGSVHEPQESVDDGTIDYQVVDTAGMLGDETPEFCRAADLVLIPMLPSTRDLEPTVRTYGIANEIGTATRIIINQFNPFGILDRDLEIALAREGMPIIVKIPKTVALAQAAGWGCSVADLPLKLRNPRAIVVFDELAELVQEL